MQAIATASEQSAATPKQNAVPNAASRRPPIDGPRMRVRLNRVELTATAVRSRSGPTRSLMNTDQTGQANASNTQATSASPTISGIEASPSQVASASGIAVAVDPHCV